MKHTKLTAIILCIAMMVSIIHPAFAAATTTSSAYTTTDSAITSTSSSDGFKLFSAKSSSEEDITSPSAITITQLLDNYADFSAYGNVVIEDFSVQPDAVINNDTILVYGSLDNIAVVPTAQVTGAMGETVTLKTQYTFNGKDGFVLYEYAYTGTDATLQAAQSTYMYISAEYLNVEAAEEEPTCTCGVAEGIVHDSTCPLYETSEMIGKTVKFNVAMVLYDCAGGIGYGTLSSYPTVMLVTGQYTDADGGIWYYVEAADGDTWPAVCEAYHYVNASHVQVVEEEKPVDQTACVICGVVGCTTAHLYCEECGKFDCGLTHTDENPYEPDTAPVIPDNPILTEGADVSIVDAEGNAVDTTGIILPKGEKISISAWSEFDYAGDLSYQWQICYDTANDLWVDIHGEQGKGILLSPAMVESVADASGTALIRCIVTSGKTVLQSDPIPVTVQNDEPLMAFFGLARSTDDGQGYALSLAQDHYTVTIEYKFAHNEATVVGSYTATLAAGTDFDATIAHPTIAGYLPYIGEETKSSTSIVLDIQNIASDITYQVWYKPTAVNYTVYHYQQNAGNDNYYLYESETRQALTGTTLDTITDLVKSYDGFYSLIFDASEKVVADGSTVVEIYYDRYYYLMRFNLNGGYGVPPIFARYGDEITIGTPTKPGYQFAGWVDENGASAVIPTTIPKDGGTYTATWDPAETTYTVAYWVQDDNTYIGSRIFGADSGAIVSGTDNLTVTCGLPEHTSHASCSLKCGYAAHTHGDENCSYCDKTEHNHTRECYVFSNPAEVSETPSEYSAYYTATDDVKNGFTIYRINFFGTYYYSVRIGGSCYRISNYNSGSTSLAYTLAATCPGEHTHSADCCTIEAHTHTDACYDCGMYIHTHTDACTSGLAKYLDFVEADTNVTVNGDGSTVVNVYYEYRTYTIRFIYARQYGTGYQIADNTRNGVLSNCEWETVDRLPGFVDPSGKTDRSSVEIDDVTYYYISLTAKFGADIADIWPDANIDDIEDSSWRWGSWAAAAGTGYRKKYGDSHANIVGPYPVMSEDMIVDNPEKLPDGTYLAQNMIAWWGGGNIENHAYHNYFELLPGEDQTGAVEYNGKYYKLAQTYTFTAAHNGNTRVDPIYFNGLTCINDTRIHGINTALDTQRNSSNFNKNGNCSICGSACYYCNEFYYDRNDYTLYFYNYNTMMDGGVGQTVPYGASLSEYEKNAAYMATQYPTGLQPGAYTFDGWYTTPLCSAGTKVNWTTATMPAADMTMYAKYVPHTYKVNFYLTRDSLDNGETISEEMDRLIDEAIALDPSIVKPAVDPYATAFAEQTVSHGDYIGAIDDPGVAEGVYAAVHPRVGYEFIGWFYLDENSEETAFDPENMPVTQNLNLYAKWSSAVLQEYIVYFKDRATDTQIADPIEGSAPAGTTKTIEAKGGTELYTGYQEGYFPENSKFSVTLDIGSGDNTYTFWYVQKDKVPYSVYYVTESNKDGLTAITLDDKTYYQVAETKTVPNNKQAIVTEEFKPVTGYVPDAYQKTLIIDANDDAANKIVFVYSVNTTQAMYKITHYIEGMTDGIWTEHASSEILGTIGDTYTAAPMTTIQGFTHDSTVDGTVLSGTLTAEGMELKLYYTRNSYPYEVRHLIEYTTTPLEDPDKGTAKYGRTFSGTAESITNYTVVGESTQTREVYIEAVPNTASVNIIIFYYRENTAEIQYKVVGPDGCGTVTPASENVQVLTGTANGSTASANTNYKFVGWYDNLACSGEALSTNAKFTPTKPGEIWADVTYYAKFELDVADLTIATTNCAAVDTNTNQSFLVTITGPADFEMDVVLHGNDSVTIKDLPIGSYTVTIDDNWSWRYAKKTANVTLDGNETVTLTNARENTLWLDGGTWCENLFSDSPIKKDPKNPDGTTVLSIAFADMVLREESIDEEDLTVQLA